MVINGFADDLSIRKKSSKQVTKLVPMNELETAFLHIKIWMDTMHLKLNSNKTEYILFGSTKQLKISTEPLYVNGDLIPISHGMKYLGGYLDQSLNFKEHVKQKAKKAMSNPVKNRSIRRYLSTKACTTLVLMLCITHLDYVTLLYDLPKKTTGNYQLIQNICVKLV